MLIKVSRRVSLRKKVSRSSGSTFTSAVATEIDRDRQRLRSDLKKWRSSQAAWMPLAMELIASAAYSEPEDEKLWLPSDFKQDQRDKFGLSALADAERQLREGEAFDAIRDICQVIRYTLSASKHKRSHAHGVTQNTRAGKILRAASEKKSVWMQKYARARKHLIGLGMSTDDPAFPPLQEKDTFLKNIEDPHTIGDGKKHSGWIWSFGQGPAATDDHNKPETHSVFSAEGTQL